MIRVWAVISYRTQKILIYIKMPTCQQRLFSSKHASQVNLADNRIRLCPQLRKFSRADWITFWWRIRGLGLHRANLCHSSPICTRASRWQIRVRKVRTTANHIWWCCLQVNHKRLLPLNRCRHNKMESIICKRPNFYHPPPWPNRQSKLKERPPPKIACNLQNPGPGCKIFTPHQSNLNQSRKMRWTRQLNKICCIQEG